MTETALADQLRLLPEYLGHHLTLTLVALSSGIALCLPLAILVTRVKSLQWPVLTVASVARPSPGWPCWPHGPPAGSDRLSARLHCLAALQHAADPAQHRHRHPWGWPRMSWKPPRASE